MATGLQQTAFSVAAEARFDCPAQWLADAFSGVSHDDDDDADTLRLRRHAWKYQYSVAPALHGADLEAYFADNATTIPSARFRRAMQRMLGNFVINDTPVVTVEEAKGGYANASVPPSSSAGHDANMDWPEYTVEKRWQMDLNTTGGTTSLVTVTDDLAYSVRTGAGMVNSFRVVDGTSWEGGRGARCDFWKSVADKISV